MAKTEKGHGNGVFDDMHIFKNCVKILSLFIFKKANKQQNKKYLHSTNYN